MSGNVATCGHLNTSGSVVGALLLSPSASCRVLKPEYGGTGVQGEVKERRGEERDIRDRGSEREEERERGKTHSLST
jgi:hypothetical protein